MGWGTFMPEDKDKCRHAASDSCPPIDIAQSSGRRPSEAAGWNSDCELATWTAACGDESAPAILFAASPNEVDVIGIESTLIVLPLRPIGGEVELRRALSRGQQRQQRKCVRRPSRIPCHLFFFGGRDHRC